MSTEEQGRSGLGLDAQRASIKAYAGAGEHDLTWAEDVGLSAKTMKRPALAEALQALKRKEADALVVAKLDRLSRSVQDFAGILDIARRQKWGLVVLDMGMDLTTPQGKAMAQMLAVFAEMERELIGERTREALAAAKARGVQLGRPVAVSEAVVARILADRAAGVSFSRIARALNDEAVPTAHGGSAWHPTTIQRIYKRTAA